MSSINYSEKIPNNVNLGEDRTLQRALEGWQPNFINCGTTWAQRDRPTMRFICVPPSA